MHLNVTSTKININAHSYCFAVIKLCVSQTVFRKVERYILNILKDILRLSSTSSAPIPLYPKTFVTQVVFFFFFVCPTWFRSFIDFDACGLRYYFIVLRIEIEIVSVAFGRVDVARPNLYVGSVFTKKKKKKRTQLY